MRKKFRQWLRTFAVAFSMYSKIPMPQFVWEQEDMRYAMCFFPFVGAVVWALLAGIWFLRAYVGLHDVTGALLAAVVPLLVTGGFHVDGYMDTMDAFSSYGSREKKLEILKDSHIGAFAVIRLACYGMVYVASVLEIRDIRAYLVFGGSFFLSRCLSGIAVVSFRPAKKDGLLHLFSDGSEKRRARVILIAEAVAAVLIMLYISPMHAAVLCGVQLFGFWYYYHRSYREIGGINGDTAGWFVTVSEGASAAAMALTGICMVLL